MYRVVSHRDRRADLVLLGRILNSRFNMGDECTAERRLKCSHHLRRDLVAIKHGQNRPSMDGARRAIYVEAIWVGRHAAVLKNNAVQFDALYSPESDYILDPSSSSSSAPETIAPCNMRGCTSLSRRSNAPADSSLANRSSTDFASATTRRDDTAGQGCESFLRYLCKRSV
jgi:hypothetical protein